MGPLWVQSSEEEKGRELAPEPLFTQILTRGKQVKVPAETVMHFRLYWTLVLKASIWLLARIL